MMGHGHIGQNAMVNVSKRDSGRVKIFDRFDRSRDLTRTDRHDGPCISDPVPFLSEKKSLSQESK